MPLSKDLVMDDSDSDEELRDKNHKKKIHLFTKYDRRYCVHCSGKSNLDDINNEGKRTAFSDNYGCCFEDSSK